MADHKVVSPDHWVEARKQLLAKEKEFTKLRDQLSEARRNLPWERVDKHYVFDGPKGKETLADLFDGRSQLVVYHFMFGPDWEVGCKSCSFWADNFERNVVHLKARDVTTIAISRAPIEKLTAFQKRLGWTFKWVSSLNNDFNFDYHVSFTPEELAKGEGYYNYALSKGFQGDERPGISVFYRDAGGAIYHTYSCYGRGLDLMNTAYNILDLVPLGRNEAEDGPQSWVRLRDNYGR
ncbi:MAG TPA: DUF899 domain-containing protein [Candidatus Cybelea sp.]|nr:DUF899 domain-containing protein [Candidatus Cybelea sp.]